MGVEGEEPEYEVEAIEDSRLQHRQPQYRVRWQGWPDLTWEPWFFANTTEAVRRFHERYPDKPGPMPEGAEAEELRRRGLGVDSLAGARPLEGGNCHGPLPVVTIGRRELTWEPNSTQDLEALSDVGLLWDARHPPECAGSRNLGPHSPTPGTLLPQPYPAGTRNPEPRLEPEAPQPLTRRQADRLKRPPLVDPPLALGPQCPNGGPGWWAASNRPGETRY